jgi:hypothetical protein
MQTNMLRSMKNTMYCIEGTHIPDFMYKPTWQRIFFFNFAEWQWNKHRFLLAAVHLSPETAHITFQCVLCVASRNKRHEKLHTVILRHLVSYKPKPKDKQLINPGLKSHPPLKNKPVFYHLHRLVTALWLYP